MVICSDGLFLPLCAPFIRSLRIVSSWMGPNSTRYASKSFSSKFLGTCPTNNLMASASFSGAGRGGGGGGGWAGRREGGGSTTTGQTGGVAGKSAEGRSIVVVRDGATGHRDKYEQRDTRAQAQHKTRHGRQHRCVRSAVSHPS